MIVDANVHATIDGSWFGTEHDASLARLLRSLDDAGVDRAVLTGLTGATPIPDVLDLCEQADGRLLPVAPFDPSAYPAPAEARTAARHEVRGHGLLGVKLHPRLGGYDLLDPRATATLDEIDSWHERLVVFVCTFLHVPGLRTVAGPVETLTEVVGRWPGLTFVLLHGCGADLLRLATAVRSARNALLDLSYTLTHLPVEREIGHLLTTFDERLVFGSDFPEGDPQKARAALEELGSSDAVAKVLGGNMQKLLG